MQCVHVVKIKPLIGKDGHETVEPHHKWLQLNNISRYRGGRFSRFFTEDYPVVFRFSEKEDAMAFKLRWL